MSIRLLLFWCILPTPILGISTNVTHKTEVKYLIPDLTQVPTDILNALKTGKEHGDIIRRGFVIQEYVAVTKKNILKVSQALREAGIQFGGEEEFDSLLLPGKIQEIRLMRKCIKEMGIVKEIYQIGMQGSGTLSCDKIETSEVLTEDQKDRIKIIINKFRSEVNYIVRKLYFEIKARDQYGNSLRNTDGTEPTIEIDVFLRMVDGKIVPVFIDGEVKFRDNDQEIAVSAATVFRKDILKKPSYLGIEVTDNLRIKARHIALKGLPATIQAYFEEYVYSNQFYVSKIISEFKQWANTEFLTLIYEHPAHIGVFLDKKVLLNAEPFGFGPSAAIAEIFPYLRDRIAHLSYIGMGHTLNLQKNLPYDDVYEYGNLDENMRKEKFLAIAKDYDVFVTASDYETAQWAKSIGLKLVIYDPLTWYWKTLPEIIQHADFYVAQNFFGVSERLQRESIKVPEYTIVPAIVSGFYNDTTHKSQEILLVNMGGLSNPFVQNDELKTFAKIVFSSIQDVLAINFHNTIYATSKVFVDATRDICSAVTPQPYQVQQILSEAKLAVMTSGLGNLYEASAMQKNVIWLPPANDSQGQQIKLLQQHGMIDFALDWHDILENQEPIDYFGQQQDVLKQIAVCMRRLFNELHAQEKLKTLLQASFLETQIKQDKLPRLAKLAQTFGEGGAKLAAESILQWMNQ